MNHLDRLHAGRTPGLGPPKFALRTMLLVIFAFCCIFASFAAAGPLVGSAVVLAVLVIFAHVAGNVLGTQLRSNGGRGGRNPLDEPHVSRHRRPATSDFAPPTQLSRRTPLGWTWMIVTAVGGIGSGAVGGVLLARHYQASATLPTITFACVAAAVLGGFATFGIFSLSQVLLGAMWQAHWHGHRRQ